MCTDLRCGKAVCVRVSAVLCCVCLLSSLCAHFSLRVLSSPRAARVCGEQEALELVIEVTEYREELMKDESFDDRWGNVGELCKAAARVEESGTPALLLFLEEVALVAGEV